jgi:hypothetical protein
MHSGSAPLALTLSLKQQADKLRDWAFFRIFGHLLPVGNEPPAAAPIALPLHAQAPHGEAVARRMGRFHMYCVSG